MSARRKGYLYGSLLVGVMGAAIIGFVVVSGLPASTPAPNGDDELSAEAEARILQVLASVELDREALIALNASEEQVVALLTNAETWVEGNWAEWEACAASNRRALGRVRELVKRQRLGRDVGEDLRAARQQLRQACSVRHTLIARVINQFNGGLSQSQRDVYGALRNGWGDELPWRMLGLSSTQGVQLGRAIRTCALQVAAAETPDAAAAAAAQFDQALMTILTADQRQLMAEYREYAGQASLNVAAAFETVFGEHAEEPVG